jgi:uncharacterized membrane protein YesL
MENYFDPDSWIMVKVSEFGDLIIANVLWLLTSLPIITLGASTAALYSVVRTPGEHRYSASVLKNYFRAFRKNFKQGTVTFLLLLLPGALAAVNLFLLLAGMLDDGMIRYVICAIPVVLFLFLWSYVFPLMARFENTVKKTLVNAVLLSVAHLPTTVLVTLINLIPLGVLLFFTDWFFGYVILWLLFGFAAIAKINTLLLERVFRRYEN